MPSSTIQTSSRSISIHGIPITSSLLLAAAFTKARTRATVGARYKVSPHSRGARALSFSTRQFPAWSSPARQKASGALTKAAITIHGRPQLEDHSIPVHPSRPDTVFIGTNNYGVMVSTDGGKSFTPTNGGFSGRFANAILADRETPNRVYASTINTATGGGFFFVSDNNGESWRPSMRSMPSRLITYAILQDARDANIIYLGTNLGVYRSTDRGTTWAPVWAIEKKKAPAKKTSRATTKATAAVAPKRRVVSNPTETVAAAQEALNAAGYHLGEPDGKPGPETTAAVKKFQGDRHLPVTGKLDSITLAALGIGKSGDSSVAESDLIIADAVNALVHTIDPVTQQPAILAGTNSGLYRSVDPSKGWEKLSYGSFA